MKMALATDTNIFLHYRPITEIDWLSIAKTSKLTLIIPPILLRELNRHKDSGSSPKRKKRAQVALKLLRSFLDSKTSEMRPGVTVEFLAYDPDLDFETYRLRSDLQDDWFLASLIEYHLHHPDIQCGLVTADLGLELKAGRLGLEVICLPDELKLPDEDDAEAKRIKDLEAEIRQLRHRIPILVVAFSNESSHTKFAIPAREKALEPQETEMAKLKSNLPKLTPQQKSGLVPPLQGVYGVPDEEYVRYNSALDEFFEQYRKYLEELLIFENTALRTIKIQLIISNTGTCPANEITAKLHIPGSSNAITAEGLPNPPNPPDPPDPPAGPLERMRRQASQIESFTVPSFMSQLPEAPRLNVSSPQIRPVNSFEVAIEVDKLKHGFSESFDPIYVVFDSLANAKSFRIDWEIHAAELPTPHSGHVDVIIEKV